ncbi:hypothetical protein E2C01_062688 [Portunus trituberculatus]|uniref:Uncharacterized protein n=1 Tax=Portunus trituberculatus TaxID=210409 RepID=A0A5B7HEQ9_PORTR|nr:hypothetical protein [Portunus trituberculatus]
MGRDGAGWGGQECGCKTWAKDAALLPSVSFFLCFQLRREADGLNEMCREWVYVVCLPEGEGRAGALLRGGVIGFCPRTHGKPSPEPECPFTAVFPPGTCTDPGWKLM